MLYNAEQKLLKNRLNVAKKVFYQINGGKINYKELSNTLKNEFIIIYFGALYGANNEEYVKTKNNYFLEQLFAKK